MYVVLTVIKVFGLGPLFREPADPTIGLLAEVKTDPFNTGIVQNRRYGVVGKHDAHIAGGRSEGRPDELPAMQADGPHLVDQRKAVVIGMLCVRNDSDHKIAHALGVVIHADAAIHRVRVPLRNDVSQIRNPIRQQSVKRLCGGGGYLLVDPVWIQWSAVPRLVLRDARAV